MGEAFVAIGDVLVLPEAWGDELAAQSRTDSPQAWVRTDATLALELTHHPSIADWRHRRTFDANRTPPGISPPPATQHRLRGEAEILGKLASRQEPPGHAATRLARNDSPTGESATSRAKAMIHS